ncbi:hypothetical protein OIU85_012895 [Salix viminalis]|uniref:Uncharacterized protein n=1 Tax=Salix viminalis TaxID=40686 RepID=A0A9Q0NQB4_SALVM|nr:hypothetical protein OIU85_012895 [Salix viminalis]
MEREVLLAGEGWPYDLERKEMRTKMKGHKCDRVAAERRAKTAKLMEQMPEMLLACKERSCCKKNRNGMFGDIYINPVWPQCYVLPLSKETEWNVW